MEMSPISIPPKKFSIGAVDADTWFVKPTKRISSLMYLSAKLSLKGLDVSVHLDGHRAVNSRAYGRKCTFPVWAFRIDAGIIEIQECDWISTRESLHVHSVRATQTYSWAIFV